jgi:ABC-2 type transport system ATP-binding protein
MSKGMKQKTAIVSAFIRDKEILIFDEPTTGLDPLMRDTFIELINNEKAKGKTIIFSTHIFLEAERCCDNVIFIDSGKIIDRINIEKLVHNENKLYRLGFASPLELTKFTKENKICKIHKQKDDSLQIIVTVPNAQIQKFIKYLTRFKLKFFSEIKHSLAHKFKEAFAPRKEQS